MTLTLPAYTLTTQIQTRSKSPKHERVQESVLSQCHSSDISKFTSLKQPPIPLDQKISKDFLNFYLTNYSQDTLRMWFHLPSKNMTSRLPRLSTPAWVTASSQLPSIPPTLSLLFCLFSGSQFISNPKSGTTPLLSSISRFIYTALFLVIILGCTILTGSAFKVLLSPGISPVKFLSRSQAILTRTEAERKL